MPEELPSKDLLSVIPGIYYDLIARVSAGIPFLVFLLWNKKGDLQISENSAAAVLLVVLGGYLVGIVFSSCAGLFLGLTKLVLSCFPKTMKRLLSHQEILSLSSPLVDDAIGIKNREAAVTLEKVAAEAVLCVAERMEVPEIPEAH